MTPAQRLGIACQLYQDELERVRAEVQRDYPDASGEEFNLHVIQRLHGDIPWLKKLTESRLSHRGQ